MEKLLALQLEGEESELRFKQTMEYRDLNKKKLNELREILKSIDKTKLEIKKNQEKIVQSNLELIMVKAQDEEITRNIRVRYARLVKAEEMKKKNEEASQAKIKSGISTLDEYIKQLESTCNNTPPHVNNEELKQIKKRVWALEGEIEALELVDQHQNDKIVQINRIVDLIGDPFIGGLEYARVGK